MTCPHCNQPDEVDHQKCLLQTLIRLEIIEDIVRREKQAPIPPKWARAIHGGVDAYYATLKASPTS